MINLVVVMLALHEIFSFILFYSCFCRSLKMSIETLLEIRLAFWALSITSIASMFAPWLYNWIPDWLSMSYLVSITIVQLTTARNWRTGMPLQFDKRTHPDAGRIAHP